MLHSLELTGVGPAEHLALELQPRVNLITGDNGLGKTFLLDVAWWVLGRTWASGYQALPRRGATDAKIAYVVDIKRSKEKRYESTFDRASQQWKRSTGRPPSPGLVRRRRASRRRASRRRASARSGPDARGPGRAMLRACARDWGR